MYVPDNGTTYTRPDPRIEAKEIELKIVPDSEKDRNYRAMLGQLSLSDKHRGDFIRRGLSEPEIEYLSGLARSLSHGYLIPFPNVEGQLCGAQIRRDKSDDGGRYRWYTYRQDVAKHNEFGELPLAVYPNGDRIWLIEGTGVKPAVSSFRHGLTTIGAAGGLHHASSKTLKHTLNALGNPSSVVLCPDAGDAVNHHVIKRIRTNLEALEGLGVTVAIAWWGQLSKGDQDIDELPSLFRVQYLTPKEFWALVPSGKPTPLEQTPLEQTWMDAAWKGWHRRRQFASQKKVNERYLPSIPQGDRIIRSAMGTGKTHQLRELVKSYPGGVVMIGSRNSLLLQTIERVNEGLPSTDQIVHIHSDRSTVPLQDPHGRVALCFDSIDRIEPQWFDGKLIILDESVGSIKHLTIGGTLKGKRRKIQSIFAQGMKRSGAVIALDGNQNNTIAKYLEALRGKPIERLENTFKPVALDVRIAVGESDRDYSSVVADAVKAMKNGHKIGFVSDSQRLCEAMDLLLTKLGKKIFRIDSQTLDDPIVKRLASQPTLGAWLASEKYDAIVLSPSAESGVDITTTGYFSQGFGVFFGILDTDQQTQHLRRVREITQWLLHCPSRCMVPSDARRSFFAGTHYREIAESIALELAAAAVAGEEIAPFLDALKDDPHYALLAELKASRDFELSFTRECLIAALEGAGHRVKTMNVQTDHATKAVMRDLREQLILRDARAIFSAEPMSLENAIRVKQSFNATLADRNRAERSILLSRIPGVEHTEAWTVDLVADLLFRDRQRIKRLENWYLLQNLDLESQRKRDRIAKGLEECWLPDIGNRLAKLAWFRKTGILNLQIEDDRIEQIYDSARSPRSQARKLGLSPGRWKPTQWLNRLFKDYLGVESTPTGYTSPEGDPLYEFISHRLGKELADFSQSDRTQTLVPQAIEHSTNECFEEIVNNSHSHTVQTLTPQEIEPSPVVKNMHGSGWAGRAVKILSGAWQGLTGTIDSEPYQANGEWRTWIDTEKGCKAVPIECLGVA